MSGFSSCRVCLHDTGLEKCISLFKSFEDSTICEQIKCIATVEIYEGDGLPSSICSECYCQLGTAITFKRKCEVSDKTLRCVQLPKIPIEYKDEVKDEISVKDETEIEVNYESDNFCTSDTQFLTTEKETETVTKKSKSIDLKLICDDCQQSFKSKCKLRVHWKKVHLAEKLICPLCKRTFGSYKAFNKHVKLKSRNCIAATDINIEGLGKSRIFHCKHCDYKCKRMEAMQAHQVTHTGEKPFGCNKCDKRFTQISSLLAHKEVNHNEYRVEITCHICGKYVKGRNAVYGHMLTHRSKKLTCDICNLTLKHRACLIKHMARHSGVKKFSCEMCPAKFYTSGELITHRKKNHFKNLRFKCDMCEYVSDYSDSFIKHKSKHTSTNVPCLVCGAFFDDKQKLALHKKTHTDRKYECPHNCDKKYCTSKSLQYHIRKKHADKMSISKLLNNTVEKNIIVVKNEQVHKDDVMHQEGSKFN